MYVPQLFYSARQINIPISYNSNVAMMITLMRMEQFTKHNVMHFSSDSSFEH